MIKSMTGYGLSRRENDSYAVTCEVKSLNSKFLDAQFRFPRLLNEKETEIRNITAEKLVRGKVNLIIEVEIKKADDLKSSFNPILFQRYYKELKELARLVGDEGADCFRLALQQPDVSMSQSQDSTPEELWNIVNETLAEALDKCDAFRITEGQELAKVLLANNESIASNRQIVIELEKFRAPRVRDRIMTNLQNLKATNVEIDPNRMEQEIIFYLEKLDITEELDRLASHVKYFKDIIAMPDLSGKKLGFLAQEIGREINTIGSKANDAEIQKVVVQMKEDLEKIKEQSLNIL